jgi:hypothetical protein
MSSAPVTIVVDVRTDVSVGVVMRRIGPRRLWALLRKPFTTMDGALIAMAIGFGFTPPPMPYWDMCKDMPHKDMPHKDMPHEPREGEPLSAAERRD